MSMALNSTPSRNQTYREINTLTESLMNVASTHCFSALLHPEQIGSDVISPTQTK